jgi:hypothetical protein
MNNTIMWILIALLCIAHTITTLQVGPFKVYIDTKPGRYERCLATLAERTKEHISIKNTLFDARSELIQNNRQLQDLGHCLDSTYQALHDSKDKSRQIARDNKELQVQFNLIGRSLIGHYDSLTTVEHLHIENDEIIAGLKNKLLKTTQRSWLHEIYSYCLVIALIATVICFIKFYLSTQSTEATAVPIATNIAAPIATAQEEEVTNTDPNWMAQFKLSDEEFEQLLESCRCRRGRNSRSYGTRMSYLSS